MFWCKQKKAPRGDERHFWMAAMCKQRRIEKNLFSLFLGNKSKCITSSNYIVVCNWERNKFETQVRTQCINRVETRRWPKLIEMSDSVVVEGKIPVIDLSKIALDNVDPRQQHFDEVSNICHYLVSSVAFGIMVCFKTNMTFQKLHLKLKRQYN